MRALSAVVLLSIGSSACLKPDSGGALPVDAGPSDAGPSDAGTCLADRGPDHLPAIAATVLIKSADGGVSLPIAAGGDMPSGRWQVERATLYLDSTLTGLIDSPISQLLGTGWVSFDGAQYTVSLRMEMAIATFPFGRVRRPLRLTTLGTYVAEGPVLKTTLACSSDPLNGAAPMRYHRTSTQQLQLHLNLMGPFGPMDLALDLTPAP